MIEKCVSLLRLDLNMFQSLCRHSQYIMCKMFFIEAKTKIKYALG